MFTYKNFNFSSYSNAHKYLVNYPRMITNYEVDKFNSIYSHLEKYTEGAMKDRRGFLICCRNPINAGTLYVPISISYGIPTLSITKAIGMDSQDLDRVIGAERLIVTDVGGEEERMNWVFKRIVSHRFSGGLLTIFHSTIYLEKMGMKYDDATMCRVASMCDFQIVTEEKIKKLATSEDSNFNIRLEMM